jgi:hypothetical protein
MRKRTAGRWAVRLVLVVAVAIGALAGGIASANADTTHSDPDISWHILDISWH